MQLAVLCHWDLTVWWYITFVKVKKEVSVLLFSTLKNIFVFDLSSINSREWLTI